MHKEPEHYVACVECKRPQGDPIHDLTKTVAETGEAQHVFIAGPILATDAAPGTP